MSEAFVAPSQSVYIVENKRVVGHLAIGGPTLFLFVGVERFAFEMHNYFGPMPLTPKTLEPTCKLPPQRFWDAYERWELGGKLVAGSICDVPEWCQHCEGKGHTISDTKTRIGRIMAHETQQCPMCHGAKIDRKQETTP